MKKCTVLESIKKSRLYDEALVALVPMAHRESIDEIWRSYCGGQLCYKLKNEKKLYIKQGV